MISPGVDNVLPFIVQAKKNRAKINGVALLHKKKMTGKLDEIHAISFVMLSEHKPYGSISEPRGPHDSLVTSTYVRANRSIKVSSRQPITADVSVSLKCSLTDNSTGELLTPSIIDKME
ncbi:hypothetical protein PCCS19_39030 [Paenibacillus sp. CCS19]|nr:hypothetical protein PCCS19_39030 [Paenibacillus cellulosilyticus]